MLTLTQFQNKYQIIKSYDIVPTPENQERPGPRLDQIDTNGNGKGDYVVWTQHGTEGSETRAYNAEPLLTVPLRYLKDHAKSEGTEVVVEQGNNPSDPNYLRFQVKDEELINGHTSISSSSRAARDDYEAYQEMPVLSVARKDKTPLFPIKELGDDAFFAVDVKNDKFLIARPKS